MNCLSTKLRFPFKLVFIEGGEEKVFYIQQYVLKYLNKINH